jgi:hypothetical protein
MGAIERGLPLFEDALMRRHHNKCLLNNRFFKAVVTGLRLSLTSADGKISNKINGHLNGAGAEALMRPIQLSLIAIESCSFRNLPPSDT